MVASPRPSNAGQQGNKDLMAACHVLDLSNSCDRHTCKAAAGRHGHRAPARAQAAAEQCRHPTDWLRHAPSGSCACSCTCCALCIARTGSQRRPNPRLAAPTAKARTAARRPEPCRLHDQGCMQEAQCGWLAARQAGGSGSGGQRAGRADPPPLQQPTRQQSRRHGCRHVGDVNDIQWPLRAPSGLPCKEMASAA